MPFRFTLDWVAAIYSLIKNKNTKDLKAIFRAHSDFLRHWGGLITKRKALKFKKPGLLFNKSVVFQHFVLKKQYYSDFD
jgi:hypothetical protein